MRILLLKPSTNWHHPFAEAPSIALLTLGGIAKELGHEVMVKHLDIDPLPEEIPDLVGITCNTFEVRSARELVKRYQRKCRIVLGGPHAIAWNGGDGLAEVVIGEGENKWLEMLGADVRFTDDIDSLPLPDFSLIDMHRFSGVSPMGGVPSMVLFGSRGCPGKCTFCNTPVFWGNRVRYRSPESIVSQIKYFNEEFGAQEVFFQDDTFNANWPWAQEILQRIIALKLNQKMVFRVACRANERMLTEDFLKLAAKAGVWNIFLGIESASQIILDLMKKHIRVDEYRRAMALIPQYGMTVQASFIIGLPGETRETLAETQQFIDETHPWMVGGGFATPFPGTELDRYLTERNQKLDVDYADYIYGRVMVRTDELSYEDLESFGGFQNHYAGKPN